MPSCSRCRPVLAAVLFAIRNQSPSSSSRFLIFIPAPGFSFFHSEYEYHRSQSARLGALLLQDFDIASFPNKVLEQGKFHCVKHRNAAFFDKQPHAVEQPFVKPFARGMIPHAVAERQVADELIIRSFALEPHYIVAYEFCLGYSAGFHRRLRIHPCAVNRLVGNINTRQRSAGREHSAFKKQSAAPAARVDNAGIDRQIIACKPQHAAAGFIEAGSISFR